LLLLLIHYSIQNVIHWIAALLLLLLIGVVRGRIRVLAALRLLILVVFVASADCVKDVAHRRIPSVLISLTPLA